MFTDDRRLIERPGSPTRWSSTTVTFTVAEVLLFPLLDGVVLVATVPTAVIVPCRSCRPEG